VSEPAGRPEDTAAVGRLDAVLPSVLTALGSSRYAARPLLPLAPARRAVVVLVDGLGLELVRRRAGHAPFLRAALPAAYRLECGFPSTTATSMGSFGTGLPPGAHGLVGYEVLDPATDRVLNELSWLHGADAGPDPRRWQPEPTLFEQAVADGLAVTMIGPRHFDGSGLTTAALRGAVFASGSTLPERVDAALAALRGSARALVYLYWGDLDRTGHVHGVGSFEWGEELERVDAELARLVGSVPSDTAVAVTADHGMVDVAFEDRLDLALEPALMSGVRHLAGEARSVQLHCVAGAEPEVTAAWRERLGDRATVWSRAEAVAAGLFGDPERVEPRVLPRIGDVVVNCGPDLAVVHSRQTKPELLALVGLHGSVTLDETAIPLLHWPARAS